MCGRFTLRTPASHIASLFELPFTNASDTGQKANSPFDLTIALRPRYNIAPTQTIVVVRLDATGRRQACGMRWGLIPGWSVDGRSGPPLINARGESVATKPSFRSAFRTRRCLVPADGFYEWRTAADGKKQPLFISMKDEAPFAFAGLWEEWRDPVGETTVESCCLITTAPNALMATVHDRMPVIVPRASWETWLTPAAGEIRSGKEREALRPWLDLLGPYPAESMQLWPVSTRVNAVRDDCAACCERWEPTVETPRLAPPTARSPRSRSPRRNEGPSLPFPEDDDLT